MKERERLEAALREIEAFGYAHSGHGFSCARMASLALGNPVREPDKWQGKQAA